FVEKHRSELASMPTALVPEAIRAARVARAIDEVVMELVGSDDEHVEATITFRVLGQELALADVFQARKKGVRALCLGSVWIDLTNAQFSWIDGVVPQNDQKSVHLSMLDYLRIRGLLE